MILIQIKKLILLAFLFSFIVTLIIVSKSTKINSNSSSNVENEVRSKIVSNNDYRVVNNVENQPISNGERKYVYLDIGANNGDSILMFLELKTKGNKIIKLLILNPFY